MTATFGWYGRSRDANPATNPASVTYGLLLTSATAGLELIDPRKLSTGRRALYRTACAATNAWVAWSESRPQSDYPHIPTHVRAALAVASAGATLGFAGASERLDGKLHNWLASKGVRKPRHILATASALLTLGAWATGRMIDAKTPQLDSDDFERKLVEVPQKVLNLVDRLLASTELCGAAELREQWQHAKCYEYLDTPTTLCSSLDIEVPENTPLAVPHDATFPVVARFESIEGKRHFISIRISGGKLSEISTEPRKSWTDEDEYYAWLDSDDSSDTIEKWPDLAEITLHIETPAGLKQIEASTA